jgi:hypothetical protein
VSNIFLETRQFWEGSGKESFYGHLFRTEDNVSSLRDCMVMTRKVLEDLSWNE